MQSHGEPTKFSDLLKRDSTVWRYRVEAWKFPTEPADAGHRRLGWSSRVSAPLGRSVA